MYNEYNIENDLLSTGSKELLKQITTDLNMFYRGIVVNVEDPMKLGRAQIRIPSIHGSNKTSPNYVDDSSLPWATPAIWSSAGNDMGEYVLPTAGNRVFVTFEGGRSDYPIYFGGIPTIINNTKYYKPEVGIMMGGEVPIETDDYNTDIVTGKERILYKSFKGATIIIDDFDGNEYIKIIDQAGQTITMGNNGTPLERRGNQLGLSQDSYIEITNNRGESIKMTEGHITIDGDSTEINSTNVSIPNFNGGSGGSSGVYPFNTDDIFIVKDKKTGTYIKTNTTGTLGIKIKGVAEQSDFCFCDYGVMILLFNEYDETIQEQKQIGWVVALNNSTNKYDLYQLFQDVNNPLFKAYTGNSPYKTFYMLNDGSTSQTIVGEKVFSTIPKQSNTNAPVNNNEFTNKKYVDDEIQEAISSLPDLSGCLNYRGHVNNVDSLPSLGQPSGTLTSPSWTYSNASLYASYLAEFMQPAPQTYIDRFTNNLGATYGIGSCYSWSGGYAMLYTDYPETIDGFYITTTPSSSTKTLERIMVHFTPQQDKPIYFKVQGWLDTSNLNIPAAFYDDGTQVVGTANSALQLTKPGWVLIDKVTGVITSCVIGNLPQQLKYKKPISDTAYYANSSGNLVNVAIDLYNSIQLISNNSTLTVPVNINYIYNEGMRMYEFLGTGVTGGTFVTNTTNVKENDVYTVGNTNEIYRANSVPAWEHWSINNGGGSSEAYEIVKSLPATGSRDKIYIIQNYPDGKGEGTISTDLGNVTFSLAQLREDNPSLTIHNNYMMVKRLNDTDLLLFTFPDNYRLYDFGVDSNNRQYFYLREYTNQDKPIRFKYNTTTSKFEYMDQLSGGYQVYNKVFDTNIYSAKFGQYYLQSYNYIPLVQNGSSFKYDETKSRSTEYNLEYDKQYVYNEEGRWVQNILPDISGKEDKSNKVTSISSSSTDTQYPSAKLLYTNITTINNTLNQKENLSNKVAGVTHQSTDTQYPTAACLYTRTKDALNYKGHVATENDLPALGQPSGTYQTPSYDYIDNVLSRNTQDFSRSTIYRDFGKTSAQYYIVIGGSSDESRYCTPFVVYTDYKEQLKIMFINNHNYIIPLIRIDYDANKPVYVAYNYNGYSYPVSISSLQRTATMVGLNLLLSNGYIDDRTGYTDYTSGDEGWAANQTNPTVRRILYTNIPDLKLCTTYDVGYKCISAGSVTSQSSTTGRDWSNWSILQSLKDSANNYVYDEGMNIIKGDENDFARLVDANGITKLNDVYTVGAENTIYRRNENVQWDVFSNLKAYAGYDATKTQTLKNVNGTLTWVDDTV